MISETESIEKIKQLAMSDELFTPESISLEPEGKSLTVRLPEKYRRLAKNTALIIPAWTEDVEPEKEFPLL